MFKRIFSILPIVISVLILVFVLQVNKSNKKNNLEVIEKNPSVGNISEELKPGFYLELKEDVIIPRNQNCTWIIKDNTAFGFYSNKSFFQQIIPKNSKLKVIWATEQRVLLPGLVFSSENQDTVILTEDFLVKELYVVIVDGDENLKIVNKRNKSRYEGNVNISKFSSLNKLFNLKTDSD